MQKLTNKEAVEVLKEMKAHHKDFPNEYAALALAIEALQKESWVSVEERLPESKDKVLVSCEHGVTMAEYTRFDNGNEMWWAVLCIGTYEDSRDAKQVTHWQPLPTAPQTNNS